MYVINYVHCDKLVACDQLLSDKLVACDQLLSDKLVACDQLHMYIVINLVTNSDY
jgi:hypothetical protein